ANGSKVFNLIATDKTIVATPFQSTTAHYGQCFSICSLNLKCLSFDHSYTSDIGECSFYDLYQTNNLKEKPGVKFYSQTLLTATDCVDWFNLGYRKNGIYEVNLLGKYMRRVYCHMQAAEGGWMAFQRRFDGSVQFIGRNWEEFKNGFGNPEGEYYLGNELLHLLTTSEDYDYLVEARSYGQASSARRKLIHKVHIESEEEDYKIQYRLEDISEDYGGATSYGTLMRGCRFSTFDHDRDTAPDQNCGQLYGGWWHAWCHDVAMNGHYSHTETPVSPASGIIWRDWRGHGETLKNSLLMIRRSSFKQ
uniref:Fibrinogen C-terminal domain-containing protein n=1 Tax=Clytia hemisphaerica TaxID=252671 RepID=A0A7M5VAU6_9CNID